MPDDPRHQTADLIEAIARTMAREYTRDDRREPNGRDREVARVVLAAIGRAVHGDGCWPDVVAGPDGAGAFPRLRLIFAEDDHDTRDRFEALLRALEEAPVNA